MNSPDPRRRSTGAPQRRSADGTRSGRRPAAPDADQRGRWPADSSARVSAARGRGDRGSDTSEPAAGQAGRTSADGADSGTAERLQKVLAAAGVGSRRICEALIFAGRVKINGEIARLGDKVDPSTAEIHVDGERVITDNRLVYLAINKPRGVVSTMSDEKGRQSLAEYVGKIPQRVYHVGRLDAESEGLLLLTNDGELAHKLTHPSFGVAKTYMAEVIGPIPPGFKKRILAGIDLEDGFAKADAFRVVDSSGRRALVELVIHEGRKHIVRRLLGELGHPVQRLIRTAIGPVHLGDQRAGKVRKLSQQEIAALFKAVEV